MAKYSAKLTNGKTITLEGDTQPTDEDFEEAAKGAGVALLPADKTVEQYAAREQGDKHGLDYAAQTVKNIPKDAGEQAKGMGNLMFSVIPKATAELGGAIGGRVREIAGFDPRYPEGTPNIDALKGIPAAIASHYKDYMDPEKRALQVRDHPVGTFLDLAAPVESVRKGTVTTDALGKEGPNAIGRIMRAPIKPDPATMVQAGVGFGTGGLPGMVKGVAGGRSGIAGRIMSMFGKAETPEAPSFLDEGAARLREAMAVGEPPMMPPKNPVPATTPESWMTGRVGTPPVKESLAGEGYSLLSPEARAHAAALNVEGPPMRPVASHSGGRSQLSDIFGSPDQIQSVVRAFAGDEGFGPGRTNHVPEGVGVTAGELRPRTMAEAYKMIGEEPPMENGGPNTLDIGRTRAGGPVATPPRPPNPNAGGMLQRRSQFSPQGALNMLLRDKPESINLPERPQPGFKLSLDSRDAMNALDAETPEAPAEAPASTTGKKATTATKAKPTMETQDALYKRLSRKSILTPEEEQQLAQLTKVMKGRASKVGLGYAAKGK